MEDEQLIAECRSAMSAMATAFVIRDPDALQYLSGVITSGPRLPASQFMLSAARLVDDVLTSGLGTMLGRDPTDEEILQAWRSWERGAREHFNAALNDLAEQQISAGLPEEEVRSTIANSAIVTDAGLATALPMLTAYFKGDEAAFRSTAAAASKNKRLAEAVRATPLIIRDLFEGAVKGAYGRKPTDAEIRGEWKQFMLQRSAVPGA